MLDEEICEENDNENSFNPYNDIQELKKNRDHNNANTQTIKYSESSTNETDIIKRNYIGEKKSKKVEIQEEKDIDQITELIEKFKNILMRIPCEDGEDAIIYGINSILVNKNKIKSGIILCDDETFLQFIFPKDENNYICFKKKIANISDIFLGKIHGCFKDIAIPIKDDCCLSIDFNDGLEQVDLIFPENSQCELFITGIIFLLRKRLKEGNSYDSDLVSLKRIWREYDPKRNKYLDINQFSQFLKNINFDYKDKTPEQIFTEIDKEANDKIRFKEFISFYELIVTGEEFVEVFQKYSTDEQKKYINIKELIEFYEKEQKQILSPEEAIKIICKFSNKAKKTHQKALVTINEIIKKKKNCLKKIENLQAENSKSDENSDDLSNIINVITNDLFNMKITGQKMNSISENNNTESMLNDYENHTISKSKYLNDEILTDKNIQNNLLEIKQQLKATLQLSFRKFVNLLIDRGNNNIFNKDQTLRNQDMDHPLTDYYVNSSHNTYLKGSQIVGKASIEMYVYVLLNGTRFVDLDTYDGGENNEEPVITHWHFPVGDISFKETLIAIKNNAFIKNEFPVVLSLENHCGEVGQEKMQKYFLEIIGRENIYVIDPVTPPLQYPSPNMLKRKFIIKNKRKRIFGDLMELKNRFEKLRTKNKIQNDSIISTNNSENNNFNNFDTNNDKNILL